MIAGGKEGKGGLLERVVKYFVFYISETHVLCDMLLLLHVASVGSGAIIFTPGSGIREGKNPDPD
jgi:hypothetical protein